MFMETKQSRIISNISLHLVAATHSHLKATRLRASLHGGEGPQVGEVTHLGGVTRLYI